MQFTSSVPVRAFGIESDQVVPGFTGNEFGEFARLIPAARGHKFDRKNFTFLRMWWLLGDGEPLYISGPTGCGKTTLIEQFGARVKIPVFDIVAREEMQKQDLVGSFVIRESGGMKFVYGPASLVWKHGGILLINEKTAAPPGFWVANKELLAGRPLFIEQTGEVIERHPNARVVFTDNTRGLVGDDTGGYGGRFRQDLSVMDEYWKLRMDYMPAAEEIELLKEGLPEFGDDPAVSDQIKVQFARALRQFAENVRDAYLGKSSDGNALEATMSTRTLLRFRTILLGLRGGERQGFKPVEDALDVALTNMVSEPSRIAIQKIAEMVFGAGGAFGGAQKP